MAQLERPQRPVDASKTPTIHTMEQLLRVTEEKVKATVMKAKDSAGEGSKSSPKGSKLSPLSSKLSKLSPTYSSSLSSSTSSNSPSSPFFQRLRHHDSEEEHGQNQKKSVLTKVKEKAKKLRHSLSKKKHEDGSLTPLSGAGLEDDGAEDGAEYQGAPMYRSEMAHEGHRENEMQQPKESLITSQKNVSSSNDKPGLEQDREKSLTRTMSKRTAQPDIAPALATATITAATTSNNIDASSNKTITKTTAEKLTPANNIEGSGAKHSITPKFQGLTVSKPEELHSSSSPPKDATQNSSMFISAPNTPAKIPSYTSPSATGKTTSAPVTPQTSSCSSPPASGKYASPTAQLWDKGISMKEYLMNKLEPGEDEKALSQVIAEAMSPRRTPGDAGVMEKVREAVTSLLRTEEPKKHEDTTTASTNTTCTSSQTPASTNTASTSQIPLSTNAQEVIQEENRGRILQAN